MSEQSPQQPVEQVYSVEEYTVDPYEIDVDYGVPNEVVEAVRSDLLRVLQERGIDIESVVFSGYADNEANPDDAKLAYRRGEVSEEEENYEALMMDGEYDSGFDDNHAEMAEFNQVYGVMPEYHFTGHRLLGSDQGDMNNPIHFAGTGPNATIGVYDRAALSSIGTVGNNDETYADMDWITVHATAESLEAAKVFDYHPRYTVNQ